MAIEDHVLNVKKIHEKMKDKPKLYRIYNFFMGMPGMLTLSQIVEFRKITAENNAETLKELDAEIENLNKVKKFE